MVTNQSDAIGEALENSRTQTGVSLAALSRQEPILIVFLRHFGCLFTCEALSELAWLWYSIESVGTTIVLVHMTDESRAKSILDSRGMGAMLRVSDPDRRLYAAFQLDRGSLWQILGPKNWWRGIATVCRGHRFGRPEADIRQLAGAFLVKDGRIVKSFRHQSSSDRPDYVALATRPDSQE